MTRPCLSPEATIAVAEDHRKHGLRIAGDRHIVLELGHVPLEHFVCVGEGAGVLGLPHSVTRFNHAIEPATAPWVLGAAKAGASAVDVLARKLFEPHAVKWLRPAAEHHRKIARKIGRLEFAALL